MPQNALAASSKTKVMRVPTHMSEQFENYKRNNGFKLPKFGHQAPAGFPFAIDQYKEADVDLNEEFHTNPAESFFLEACDEEMIGEGIEHGDWLIVDSSMQPNHADKVIANIDGRLVVRHYCENDGVSGLLPLGEEYPKTALSELKGVSHITGVVVTVMRKLRRKDAR